MPEEKQPHDFQSDIDLIGRIDAIPSLLEVACRTTGMGFAAVARVTKDRWIACSVFDEIGFGLKPGGELKVETTICDEIRDSREPVIIDNVSESATYCSHHTPAMYGFQSYISLPIILSNGSFFGTLCAIDPRPAQLNNPKITGMFRLFAELIAKHLDDKRRSAETALLSRLATLHRQTSDPEAIMRSAAEALGSFLDLDRTGFYEAQDDVLTFCPGWTAGSLPRLAGSVPASVLESSDGSPLSNKGNSTAVVTNIIRDSIWRAGFYANHSIARRWSDEESQLVRDFAEQTWDAVERARTDLARRASEERLSFALDAGGGVGTWDWDIPNDLVYCNQRFAKLFSIDPGRAEAGVPVADFVTAIHPDDRKVITERIGHAVTTGGEYAEEYRVVQPGGFVRSIYARGRCHLDAQGNPSRFPGVVFDVTERRSQDRKMLETAKLESLGVLAGGIAHDFNNLLTGIMGNASLLETLVSDEHRQFAEEIVNASERAAHLTRQMLAYSGKGRFQVSHVNLTQQTREILPLIKPSLGGVQATLNLNDNLPAIKADPSQIEQIIMNLVINAAEALESKTGTVTISTGVEEVDRAYIARTVLTDSIQPGTYVWLEVQDTGIGMSKETLTKVFDPFFTTKFTGRGLGLAAVSGIVRGHRGAIKIDSAPGAGTTFRVLFPVSSDTETSLAPAAPVKASVKGHILFVDDEDIVRSIGRSILTMNGYSVRTAKDGQEAVDVFRSSAPNTSLILLDMTMPGMTGEEAFRRLRAIRPDVPIVISSGFNEVEVIRRFTTSNVAGFIQKPYTARQLLQKINAGVASQQME